LGIDALVIPRRLIFLYVSGHRIVGGYHEIGSVDQAATIGCWFQQAICQLAFRRCRVVWNCACTKRYESVRKLLRLLLTQVDGLPRIENISKFRDLLVFGGQVGIVI
jgi:hypothetical protein